MHDFSRNEPSFTIEVNALNIRFYSSVELMGADSWTITGIARHKLLGGQACSLEHALPYFVDETEKE